MNADEPEANRDQLELSAGWTRFRLVPIPRSLIDFAVACGTHVEHKYPGVGE